MSTSLESEPLPLPRIVSRDEWLMTRKELLASEKELTRQRDVLNAQRRMLPMVRIDKPYEFERAGGRRTLLELFDGRRQLIVYHFMFEPDDPPPGKTEPWSEGCSGCSFFADNVGNLSHLHARETSFVMVSRARLEKIRAFQARMGWTIPWYSSFGSEFNYDFHVTTDESLRPVEYNYQDRATLEAKKELYHLRGEQPGLSVFLRDGDRVFHTYSTYGRGLEMPLGLLHLLDLTPFGRGEGWGGQPDLDGLGLMWTKHHDRYTAAPETNGACCH